MTASGYAAGAYVIYQGQLYQARAAVPAGTFNPAQWTTVGGSITVAASAPANPFQGQLWWDSVSGQLFVFYDDGNSQQWVVAINERGSYLSTSGGNLTGPLSGPGNNGTVTSVNNPPAGDNSQAFATTSWVQGTLVGRQNRNRIINGSFTIGQYAAWNSPPYPSGYWVDRWYLANSRPTAINLTGNTSSLPASGYALQFVTLQNVTPAATDAISIQQWIEFNNIASFQFGTPLASPITLSFWAYASIAGTYSGSITDGKGTLSYPFIYNITAANTWKYFVITIPGPTSGGTWFDGVSWNNAGMMLSFDLGSGANYRGTPGGWQNSNLFGATGTVQLTAGAVGGMLLFTNVQLELGSQATPFDWRPYGEELALCQRYFLSIVIQGIGGFATGAVADSPLQQLIFPTTMRVAPTVGMSQQQFAGVATALSTFSLNQWGWQPSLATNGSGPYNVTGLLWVSAEL